MSRLDAVAVACYSFAAVLVAAVVLHRFLHARSAFSRLADGLASGWESCALWLALRGVYVPAWHRPRHRQHCVRHEPAAVLAAPVPVPPFEPAPRPATPAPVLAGCSPAELTIDLRYPAARAGGHLGIEPAWEEL